MPDYDFLPHVPEDVRSDPSLKLIHGETPEAIIGSLAKGYAHAQRKIGEPHLPVPSKDWKPEQWDAFYKSLGRPDAPTGYKIPEIKFAEGLSIDQKKLEKWQGVFHKHGLMPQQAEAIMTEFLTEINGEYSEDFNQRKSARDVATKKLRDELGDKYQGSVDMALAVIRKYGGEDFVNFLEQSGLGNHPALIGTFMKIGQFMAEDKAHGGGGDSTLFTSQAQAQAEISKLSGDGAFQNSLNNREDPGHAAAVARWEAAFKAAYPGQQD